MKARLLLVEDDSTLARGLSDNFAAEGYEVRHETQAAAVANAIRDFRPEILVLDIMLPDGSGLDILKTMRRNGDETPVLMLTARGELVDRVVGLELGADDYLPKPFEMRELTARIGALLRRAKPLDGPSQLTLGTARFDFRALTAEDESGAIELTPHAILVLRFLAERPGTIVSRLDIVEEICGLDSATTSRTVDNHIVALRRAIGDDPRRPRYIKTVRGQGYRLDTE